MRKTTRWVTLAAALACVSAVTGTRAAEPYSWTDRSSFRDVAVTASSEDPLWPAANVVNGKTDGRETPWLTTKTRPRAAWVELRTQTPRTVRAVRLFHQGPGLYRSRDYAVKCWQPDGWRLVADVKGNERGGWIEHACPELTTDRVRIEIRRSAHGTRMGLDEVVLVGEPAGRPAAERVSAPHFCGARSQFGHILWEADAPKGVAVRFATRTAPDAGGKPGTWSAWSAPVAKPDSPIASPPGAWLQYRVTWQPRDAQPPVIASVRLGFPEAVQGVSLDSMLPRPGDAFKLAVRFAEPMRPDAAPRITVELPGRPSLRVAGGAWGADGTTWQGADLALPKDAAQGMARLRVAGACVRRNGLEAVPFEHAFPVGEKPVLDCLIDVCGWTMKHPDSKIFVEGYNQRATLALYEITGDRKYLDHVKKWANWLLDAQRPEGYWDSGYNTVYFADTGCALALLFNLHKHVDAAWQQRIVAAMERYIQFLHGEGPHAHGKWLNADGSIGVGYWTTGKKDTASRGAYTIATTLAGPALFGPMHYLTGSAEHKLIAQRTTRWCYTTSMAKDGCFLTFVNGKRKKREWPFNNSTYVGEGGIAAWVFIDDPAWRAELKRLVRPQIEWLLRNQNPDGSFAQLNSPEQWRAHGIGSVLVWWYTHVERDPRVADAMRNFVAFFLSPDNCKAAGIKSQKIATSLTARSLATVLRPEVDCRRWKD